MTMFCLIDDFNKILFMEVLGRYREDASATQ